MVRSRVPAVVLGVLLTASLLVTLPSTAAQGDTDPGISPSFSFFPGHDTVEAGLLEHQDHPWVTLHELGTSKEGRKILMAEITDPDSAVPMEDRPITFIFTQQHGNEPAGTPAALQLLDDITSGKAIADTLGNQILLLLPMANPDGATANQRRNADNIDINRDHITLQTGEARILHQVLNDWDIHVAMDHHEYGGTGFGNPVPVRVYDYDLTTLFPVHGNVRDATHQAAYDLMYEGIWPEAEEEGYSANEYGEQTIAGIPIQELAGGPDPGIMRNHMGLHHIAGLLVETRVDAHPNPFHDAMRRIAVHSVVMEATLEYVSAHAERFLDAKAQARDDDHQHPWDRYVEGEERTAAMAPAYRAPADAGTGPLFDLHGLHPGHTREEGVVHNLAGEAYAGHGAAIVHPQSSRAIVDGVATEPFTVTEEATPTKVYESPAPVLLVVGLFGLVAAALRRRRQE